jgi:acetyl-CoA synthetase
MTIGRYYFIEGVFLLDTNLYLAPERYNLTMEIEKHASGKTALKWLDENGSTDEITYQGLLQEASRIAGGLAQLGLNKGDRILVIVPRFILSYAVYLACFKLGLVVIPSSEMLRAKDLSYRIRHAEARAVIACAASTNEIDKIEDDIPSLEFRIAAEVDTPAGWESLLELMQGQADHYPAVDTHRDDMALLAYTSGTTGNPKGVVHTHGWAYAHLRITAASWLDIRQSDTVWATAAPGWQKWIWSPFLSVLGMGATGFVYHGKFQADRYLQLLQDYRIQVLCCTPTEYRLMAKSDRLDRFDLSGLRSAVSAGEPLNREVIDIFRRHFSLTIRDGYGQTESTLLIGTLKDMEMKPGSMGKATADGLVEVVDEEGHPVHPGEIGDIGVHSSMPALFSTYYKEPERKAVNVRGEYFITGDRASKDEDGCFWFQGRSDDIIISSGYTIGPFEVEDALMKHAAVKECAVVASPDEIRGHVVKAFIVLRDESAAGPDLVCELQEHVKQWTAPYKYPRKIDFVPELPKTSSGKIRRVDLRDAENRSGIAPSAH